jgi:predicted Zn-dependent protease
MAAVNVKLGDIGSQWTTACKQAVSDLNLLFRRKGIEVALALNGAGPTITVRTDPGILGTAVHGQTSAETNGAGKLLRAEVRLPVKLTINTPKGMRDAGTGMAEVVAAHEFVHALGHAPHTSHLMAQTLYKVLGDRAAGDKLKAGAVAMPPLQLSDESVEMLKGIWS